MTELIHWVLAQADAGARTSDLAVTSVWDFILKGGWMMIPLGLCSLVVVAVSLDRLLTLKRRLIAPPGFADQLGVIVDREGIGRAIDACRSNDSPLAHVCAAALSRVGLGVEACERQAAEAGVREVHRMRARMRALVVVASVAPLMGLLGTIFGMIRAFQTVALSGEALGRTELLARGIYEAMITTAAGLLVAIPALIMHHWLSARVESIASALDDQAMSLIDRVALSAARDARASRSRDEFDDADLHAEAVAADV